MKETSVRNYIVFAVRELDRIELVRDLTQVFSVRGQRGKDTLDPRLAPQSGREPGPPAPGRGGFATLAMTERCVPAAPILSSQAGGELLVLFLPPNLFFVRVEHPLHENRCDEHEASPGDDRSQAIVSKQVAHDPAEEQ